MRTPMELNYEKLIIPILFIILFVVIIFAPVQETYTMNGDLYINEVMSSNKETIAASNGKYYDYIELYNGNGYDINLEGYYLSDDNSNTKKFKFPEVTIKAHDYLLVYASGLTVTNTEEIHANFKIDSKGEIIFLFEPDGELISKLNVNSMLADTAYGFNGERYVYYYNGTPGKENTGEYSLKPITSLGSDIDVTINEYILDNVSSIKATDGKYYNMVELYNNGKTNINLEGFHLTNEEEDYIFPEITIKSHDYLVVYFSGLDKIEENSVHTTFKIDNKSKTLILLDNNKKMIDKVKVQELSRNISCGKYDDKWHLYNEPSFGKENTDNYIKDTTKKEIIISEVSAVNPEAVEIKNISGTTINLQNYALSDKSGIVYKFGDTNLANNNYLSVNSSKLGFSIGTIDEIVYLLKDNVIVDTFNVDKLRGGVSVGISNNKKVYYKNLTFGKENSSTYYLGYAMAPSFSIDGGYVESGTKVSLKVADGSKIYYTLDGSFPTNNSTLYKEPITITKNTVVKAISYKDNYLESDVVSRTFLVGRKHDLAVISISSNYNNLFGNTGLITNYTSNALKKISFEFYENDGSYGTSFVGEAKLSGNLGGSRDKAQKAMTLYLRKTYGNNTVTYPFFKDNDTLDYSSILLRNGGEDYMNIHIFDAALQVALKGTNLDMQDYRPVVVYLNGEYYGISNMRDKLNSDYVSNTYDLEKDDLTIIKYSTATKGTTKEYNALVNYIRNHNTKDKAVYEYLKTQIDMEELCNYWIAQSFYGNTDLGNIKYWKSTDGKWRFMLYDIDWSLYYTSRSFNYPVISTNIPAVTYVYSTIDITRRLYQNSEFRDLYLTQLAYHLKNTFKPERMNKIIDELAQEIENEVPYHNTRWANTNSSMGSMNTWKSNLTRFKTKVNTRYNYVVNNLKSSFNLSNADYDKYFGDLK